jgi:GT2 family glycosyltransferase
VWKVSAIVTTYNQSEKLRLVVASLEKQTVPLHEVVIADDGSSPEHEQCIEEIIRRSPLRIVHARQEHRGFRVAANRNNGVRHSTGDYLFFLDGDLVLLPDSLKQHVDASDALHWLTAFGLRLTEQESRAITEESIRSGAFERLWPGKDDPRWCDLREEAQYFRIKALKQIFWPSERRFRQLKLLGMQFSLPRAAFEKINGFDELYEGWGQEDLDLGLRLQIAGYKGRTLMDRSRAFHLYHKRESNLDYYHRPRHGEFYCARGLFSRAEDTPPPIPNIVVPRSDPVAE